MLFWIEIITLERDGPLTLVYAVFDVSCRFLMYGVLCQMLYLIYRSYGKKIFET